MRGKAHSREGPTITAPTAFCGLVTDNGLKHILFGPKC